MPDGITLPLTFRCRSALKHGNPATSELGFQARRDLAAISISTGELNDAMTATANVMISRYSSCQLAWAAQVLAATTARYAVCEPAVLKAVNENWRSLPGLETAFAQFLEFFIEDRAGHLDMARDSLG